KERNVKPSEPVVCLPQSSFELLLELAVFLFQFFDATLFREDHHIFPCIGFACGMSHPLPYRLFSLLLPEALDPISQLRLTIQVRFTHTRCFCNRVEVDCLVVSQETGDGCLYPLALFLFTKLRVSNKTGCVAFPSFLIHVAAPEHAAVPAIVPIPPECTRARTSRFSPRSVPA